MTDPATRPASDPAALADAAEIPLSERPLPKALLESDLREVSPDWIDYNGHMNIGYYGLAFDRALDDIYEGWLDMGASYVARTQMGPFALQENIHFLQEVRLGQRFRTRLLLLDFDHKRMHFIQSMYAWPGAEESSAEPYLAATAEQISMNVDHGSRRSAPYPERVHARLSELMAAQRDLPRPAQVGAPLGIRRAR